MQVRFLALLNANHDLKQHDRDEPEDHHVQVKRAARLVHVLRVPRLGLDRLGGPLDLRVDRAEQRLTSFGARTRGRRARVSHQPMRGIRPTLAARRRLAGFAACCAGARGNSRCAGASPCACLWPSRAGGRPRPRDLLRRRRRLRMPLRTSGLTHMPRGNGKSRGEQGTRDRTSRKEGK